MHKALFLLHVWLCAVSLSLEYVPEHMELLFGMQHHVNKFSSNVGDEAEVEELHQPLDHFDPTNEIWWSQPYQVYSEAYKPGGPVFFTTVYDFRSDAMSVGYNYAKRFDGLFVALMHRYYGAARPTADLSWENLKYLTTAQALADSSRFIHEINDLHDTHDAKWIAFGGFMLGAHATWLRLKYPHQVFGAVASSPSLISQFAGYSGYLQSIEKAYANHSLACVGAIKAGITELDTLLEDQSGQAEVCDTLGVRPMEFTKNDKTLLNYFLAYKFYGDYENVLRTCKVMLNTTLGTPLRRIGYIYNNEGLVFIHSYQMHVLIHRLTGSTDLTIRQQAYQLYTEFGYYPISTDPFSMFGNNVGMDFFDQLYSDIFGHPHNLDSLFDTNSTYGGTNIDVSNVVFVQGTVDPYLAVGVQKNISASAPVILIEGEGHMSDMKPPSSTDSPQLKAARETILQYIGSWLK